MKSSFWTSYISDHTIKAICWTLIHSLWIGLAAALLAGIVITITRKTSAALRYNLLCGILVLFALSAGITFYLQMRTPAIEQGAIHSEQLVFTQVKHIAATPVIAPQLSLSDKTVMLFNEYTNIIFMAWLLLFVLKSLKMAGGLLYIQRIRNYKVHEVPEEFKHKIELFAGQIGIRQAVRLLQSELVKVPVAVGWLKPVILLPMGILLQLSPEQMDSILWHELAHIRRRDYLVNILQGLVETVFFFNPGLLWLSSLIRAEREACCDDMVLGRMNRKANYLEALLAFGNEDNSRISLAMGIGSGNQLRDRMKRIISQENKRLSMAEKVVLIAGLAILSAFTGLPKTTHQAVKKMISAIVPQKDTIVTSKPIVLKPADKTKPESLPKQGLVLKDTIIKKPDTSIRFYSVIFKDTDSDPANCDMKASGTDGNMYHFTVSDNKLVAMTINDVKVSENKLPDYEYLVKSINQMIQRKRLMRMENLDAVKMSSPMAKNKDKVKFSKKKYLDTALFKSFQDDAKVQKWKSDMFDDHILPQGMKSAYLRKSMYADDANFLNSTKRVKDLIADLVKDKIVADSAAVKWFGLSNTEFIVNGQKQPDAMQQRYKAKYDVHEDYGLYYGPVQMTGKGVFIDVTTPDDGVQNPMPRNKQLFKTQQFKQKQFFSADAELRMKDHDMPPRIALQDIVANIADDLVKDNIVKDKNDLHWFNLTNASLVVNGKAQSEKVHQKLKDKYLRDGQYPLDKKSTENPNFGLHYNINTGSMGLGIMSGGKDD